MVPPLAHAATPAEALIRSLLPRYGLAADTPLTRLCHSENETWAAADTVFRLHRAGYHGPAEIASELAWLEALRPVEGLACVRPKPDGTGRVLQAMGGRHIVAFHRLPGRTLEAEPALTGWFPQLGAMAARLHAHARGWTPPPGFCRKRWDAAALFGPRAIWGDWRRVEGLAPPARTLLTRLASDLATRLAAWGTGPERFGLIHADLRLANLMVTDAQPREAGAMGPGNAKPGVLTRGPGDGVPGGGHGGDGPHDGPHDGRLTAIDFDDCGFGWWLFDFAAAVSFIEDDPRLPALAAAWAEGYRSTAPLGPEAEAMLPVMVLARRLQLTAWLASRAGNDTAAALDPGFTAGTVALAEAFLARGPARLWGRP
ncbi:MAG: phosphotransferase enzyme family protein [Alkalilacustris sp.]